MLKRSKELLKKDVADFTAEEFQELSDILVYHNHLYYNKQEPIISDFEYDSLYNKLKKWELLLGVSFDFTATVGSDLVESTFNKVQHSRPMISLDNTYNEEDLNDFHDRVLKNIWYWVDNISYTIEFKFDGLWVELIYKNGKLVQAITRWNGIQGEDVTQNIMQIDNIPKTIPYTEYLEVRGEVVMPISSFECLNETAKKSGWKIFSNPRNAASGSLRMIDNRVTKQRKLEFFAYDLANFSDFVENEDKESYYDVIKDLEQFGFHISSYFIKNNWVQEVISNIDDFWDIRKTLDFEIDGLVIKVNDITLWSDIGSTEHHPRYAIAYKFPAEVITTQLLSVQHSIGRTGTITPVANLEPVNIGWVIVKRATLHNYEEIEKLGIKIGDHIFIKRAWEVIPKVISVIIDERIGDEIDIEIPKICPSCGHKVLKDENKVRYYCPNKSECPAQAVEKLTYSVGKQGLDIDGFWPKQVELFLQEGILTDLASIFHLQEHRDHILQLEGFQEKSVNKLLKSIQKVKNIDITKLLTTLQIPNVGKKTSKELSKLFKSQVDILHFWYEIEELEVLKDIWSEIAREVKYFFQDERNIELLEKLVNIFNIEYYNNSNESWDMWGVFFQKKVCITWSFEGYKREELAAMLEQKGGEFMSSVSKKTDYLLAGDKAGSKLVKANDLWVEVLSLEDFLEKVK